MKDVQKAWKQLKCAENGEERRDDLYLTSPQQVVFRPRREAWLRHIKKEGEDRHKKWGAMKS